MTVGGENDPPVGADLDVTIDEDGTAQGQLPQATDADGDPLTYGLADPAANGTATVNTDGSYTYVPNPNFNGTDIFTYTVTDGTETVTYTVTVTVNAVNDPPSGADDAITTAEDTPFTGRLPVATDPDGDTLRYSLAAQAENGIVSINADGTYTYTPDTDFDGADSFTYAVSDGTVIRTYTVSVTITPENDAPVGRDDAVETSEDMAYDGQLPAATDVDGDTLTYGLGSQAANGTVTVNPDGSYTYVPNANFNGTDRFDYTLTDGTETVSYTVTITVGAVNDPPVGENDAVSTDEDTPFDGQLPIATDADGDTLTYGKGSDPANGTVTVNADGSYVYTPKADFNGTDSFTYTVTDGAATATYIVTITVEAVNDAPVGRIDAVSTSEDTPLDGRLPVATDVDGDTLTYGLDSQAGNGLVTVNADGTYRYVPNANFTGADSFIYTVTDGTDTVTYTVTITVGAVNDPPVGADDAVSTDEDTPLDGQLPIATDADGDTLTYGIGSQPLHGTVTVNGDGSYVYSPAANYNGTDTFTYTVSDGTATSTYTVTITIDPVNDAPVGSDLQISVENEGTATGSLPPATDPEGSPVTYAIGAATPGAVVVVNDDGTYSYTPPDGFSGIDTFTYTVSDGDETSSYTVTVTVGPANLPPTAGNDTVDATEDETFLGTLPAATDPEGSPVTYALGRNAINGSVTVNADGTYTYTPNPNFSGTDTFTYTVSDGSASSVYTVTINVAEVNDAPVGSDTSISVTEDVAATGTLPPATDPEGQPVTYGLGAILPVNGTIVINADGTYIYTPRSNFSGTDSFTYTVSDGDITSTYTVSVTIDAVNDAPVGANDAVSTNEDTAYDGQLPAATDADGDPLTYGKGSDPANGTVIVNPDGTYTYTPNANFNGTDSFTYIVTDGTATRTYTVNITVAPQNDAPVGRDDTASTNEDTPFNGQLPVATDVDGDTLTYGLGAQAENGTVAIDEGGSYTYTPNANFYGTDTFTYTVSDGTTTASYTVTVTVGSVNDAPIGSDAAISTDEDTPVTGQIPVATDADGDTLTYAKGSDPSNGTVTFNGDGTYTYTPNANFNGTDSFTYTVSDGTATRTYTITITVGAENDPPVGEDLDVTIDEDGTATGQLPQATDLDGDALAYALGTQAGNGTATVNADGGYSYVPNPNFNGTDSFTYTVSDGTATVSYTVTITVNAIEDAPVGSDGTIATNEDTPFNGRLPIATDADGDMLTYGLGTQANHGAVVINANGTYRYVPATNFNGADSFTYTVTDGNTTVSYTVAITVNAVGDAPVGSDGTIITNEDTAFNGRLPVATDADGDALTYGLGTQASHGSVVINADGTYRYVPAANFNGADSFTYTVSDGTTTVSYMIAITVNAVADAPVGSDGAITTNEDTAFNGRLPIATDADGDTLTYGLGTPASHGSVVINADGTYRYVPAANFNGTDSFTYTVSDGATSVSYTIAITVTPVNDAPVGEDAVITTPEDTVATGQLPQATDAEGSTLTYGLGAAPSRGTVIIDPDGTYRYIPNRNFNGTDSFTYTVSDGTATSTYTVTVTVTPVNDAPLASDTSISATSGTTTTGSLPPATDPEGSPVTYGLGSQAQHGTVIINADGTYSYRPVAGYAGADSFTYTVGDGQATSTYTVTVSVGAANQPPVGADASVVAFEDTPLNGRLPVATDVDGDTLTYGLGAQAVHGTVTVNRDGTYTYVPALNYNGTDSFTYTVSDGRSTSTYTVTVTVDPVNDPPVASDTSVSVTEGTSVTGMLPPAFDPEGQPISYGLGTGPQHGTVTINPDGTYSYTPADGYDGPDSFTYTISDGTNTATYTVVITVDPAELSEEPRPPLEVDPPPPISAEPTDPWQPPSISGDDSTGSTPPISSIMDDLNGIADLTAQGPIANVVNSIRSLNGIGWLPDEGAVIHAANQIGEWRESGGIIDELTAGFFKGGSNIHLEREGAESTWFQIDTMVYNDYLYIMPSSQGEVEDASFGVTLADGSPLPDWLKPTRQGLVIGRPPVGLPFIDLRIYGTSSDGVISDTIRIDLQTGAILDHVSDQRTQFGPAMFSDSMMAAMPSGVGDDGLSALGRALERWNEAPRS